MRPCSSPLRYLPWGVTPPLDLDSAGNAPLPVQGCPITRASEICAAWSHDENPAYSLQVTAGKRNIPRSTSALPRRHIVAAAENNEAE